MHKFLIFPILTFTPKVHDGFHSDLICEFTFSRLRVLFLIILNPQRFFNNCLVIVTLGLSCYWVIVIYDMMDFIRFGCVGNIHIYNYTLGMYLGSRKVSTL